VSSLLRSCLLEVAVLLSIISLAWAADETVTLRLGAGSTLTLESPFETVMVGDPNIVNVHAHSDRLVILEPLHLGETNLVFLDKRSITIANVRIVVSDAVPINYTPPKLPTRSMR
jgi:Flp pilus assembly secretin CpaC